MLDSDPTIAEVKQELRDELGSLLVTPMGQSEDVRVIGADGDNLIQFQITLANSFTVNDLDLDLALGDDPVISALIGAENQVDVDIDWQLEVTFSVTATSFQFITSAIDELTIEIDATLDDTFAGKGRMGVLIAELEAVDNDPQNFMGTYTIDVQDDNGDGLLAIADIADVESIGELTGDGEANLAFNAAFFQDFFNLGVTDIFNLAVDGTARITYNLDSAATAVFNTSSDQITSFGDDPVIEYNNLGLDLGTFFNDFIKPTIEGVQDVLEPISPVIDFLNEDLPLLDDLGMTDDGGNAYTPLTLAAQIATTAGEEQLAANLTTVAEIVNILDIILAFDLSPQENSAGTLSLGSFTASANRSLSGPIVGLQADITTDDANDDAREQAEGNGSELSSFLDALGSKFEFPLLKDPTNFFSLLVGDSSPELFTMELAFEFNFPFRFSYPVIPGLLTADFALVLGAAIDFGFGYDALGVARFSDALNFDSNATLQTSMQDSQVRALLLDGFYIDDHNDDLDAGDDNDMDAVK